MFRRNCEQREILEELRRINRRLEKIESILKPNRFSIQIQQEKNMASPNGIILGSTGTFNAVLQDNGSPIALPTGASWAWNANDSGAQVAQDPSDATGATVNVSIPAGDTNATVTVTASTTDPTGATQTGSLTFPVLPVPQQFTVVITQTA